MATVEHCIFCFEALTANLEKRPPMSLFQVQSSWAAYPKGLEAGESSEEDEDLDPSSHSIPEPPTSTRKSLTKALNPTLARLAGGSRSNSSTPVSTSSGSSTSSLSPSTEQTTPSSSTSAFTPIGISPHKTSQRPSVTISDSPLFVTWNTVSPSTSHRSLRGCIGTFESLPLSTGLSSYALTSALSDTRFPPISLRELPSLEVSVTLLTDFEPGKDAMDWDLGVHGIRISFYARNRRYGACYLPDVAVEQGWDKEETVVSLMRKAGWGGRRSGWRDVGDFELVRFQGVVESVGWEEFRRWRVWAEKGEGK